MGTTPLGPGTPLTAPATPLATQTTTPAIPLATVFCQPSPTVATPLAIPHTTMATLQATPLHTTLAPPLAIILCLPMVATTLDMLTTLTADILIIRMQNFCVSKT